MLVAWASVREYTLNGVDAPATESRA